LQKKREFVIKLRPSKAIHLGAFRARRGQAKRIHLKERQKHPIVFAIRGARDNTTFFPTHLRGTNSSCKISRPLCALHAQIAIPLHPVNICTQKTPFANWTQLKIKSAVLSTHNKSNKMEK
jgi:hypothetical protein